MAKRPHTLGIGVIADNLRSAFLSYNEAGKHSLRECAALVSACFRRPHYLPDIAWRVSQVGT
jgi:hypothetical protein